jgi:selenocysteine lyase/cysteine desulfurase
VRDRIKEYPQLRLANASADAFYGGLVSFEPVKGDLKRVLAELAARNVRVAGGPERIRVATHIFTQPTELNALFDAIDRGMRK